MVAELEPEPLPVSLLFDDEAVSPEPPESPELPELFELLVAAPESLVDVLSVLPESVLSEPLFCEAPELAEPPELDLLSFW